MEDEMTREEMQRFLIMEHRQGKSELQAYRNLMRVIDIAFPGKPQEEKKSEKSADLPSK